MLESRLSNDFEAEQTPLSLVADGQSAFSSKLRISSELLTQVEHKLLTSCTCSAENSRLISALHYHLKSGGNRSRVRLCLRTGEALGLLPSDSQVLAVSIELLHNASLIQDDLQDKDTQRRGQPAVWQQFGTDVALGLVDLMIASAFKNLTDLADSTHLKATINKLHEAIGQTLDGQSLDLSDGAVMNVDHCLKVARMKSGPLFALALELPILVAGHHSYLEQAHDAACSFGTGYQIYDDILDFDQDRRHSHSNNVVCALNEDMRVRESFLHAITLAKRQLSHAKYVAHQLPNRSGRFLAEMTARLELKLEDFAL